MYADLQFHQIGLHLKLLIIPLQVGFFNYLGMSFILLQLFFFPQRTPLHMAAEGGHEDTVKYLVEKGAGIGVKDNKGVK